MTIKGTSDRIRLPRKGILRVGEKVKGKNGAEYPKALDHFVGPEEFHKYFGEAPVEVPIIFPFPTLAQNYDEHLKAYKKGGKLFCRGDGEVAQRSDGEGGIKELDCPHTECEFFKKRECKPNGVLTFLIPTLSITGAYQFWTSSQSSMDNLRSTLTQMEAMFGKLSGIDMTLKVKMAKANPWVMKDGKKVQISTQVPVVFVECNLPMPEVRKLAGQKNLALKSGKADEEIVDNDTYPETIYETNVGDAEVIEPQPVEPESAIDDPHPSVAKFYDYAIAIKTKHGVNILHEFMTVKNKTTGETRCPTFEQVQAWRTDKEIDYLNHIIKKIEAKYPEMVVK